ncbi:MvaI/BcnI restriction endonuclease family protein, partial [Verrucomicrobia bacterium]|nr:MvaI/BcnI restriction endonuclease family protein [Verrucomicrobiota bacterium]
MNTRKLSAREEASLSQVKKEGLCYALLFITETGLRKSILDATQPIRTLLSTAKIHDFHLQGKGPKGKVQIPSLLILAGNSVELKTSLYRPGAKNGDPRIWFLGF